MKDGTKATITVSAIVATIISIICTSFHGEVLP